MNAVVEFGLAKAAGKDIVIQANKLHNLERFRYLSRESSEEKQGWIHCQTYGGKPLD